MRVMIRLILLASFSFFAIGAFAANRAVVNIPFNFVSQGHAFPAGHYVATLDSNRNVLALRSMKDARISAHWIASPAESNPNDQALILKFDGPDDSHTLRTLQLGSQVTPRLDAPRRHNAGSITAEVSGQ